MNVARFAPSTTGQPHPGTLLAALLCWLDARSCGARLQLRFENIDPERCRPVYLDAMRDALSWLGLDWDEVVLQTDRTSDHEAALDELAAAGRLYPCRCSRAQIRAGGRRAPDGGWHYGGRCRDRSLPASVQGGWRACTEAIRLRLPAERIELVDEGGLDLSQDPVAACGDPVVRRRDGAVAYHLACTVDDAASGVTRIVRGRDLAVSTATQVALQRLLGYSSPRYRHHLLLLEERGGKLAKLHGSVGIAALRRHYDARSLCGALAHLAGLRAAPAPASPQELLPGFSWFRVRCDDCTVRWSGSGLEIVQPAQKRA